MLVSVFFLAVVLPVTVNAGGLDPNCTVVNPADGKVNIAPSATKCTDKMSNPECTQLFAAPAKVGDPADGTGRNAKCFQLGTAPSENIKQAAIELCPSYCGFCCVTPEYNCENAKNPRINCDSITTDMCGSIEWREIIAQDCPSACGFCLLGGCIDAAPDCEKQQTICSNTGLSGFTQVNCKRTCGLCGTSGGSSSTTMSSIIGGGACGDSNPNCATWVRNGFCNNNFYTLAQKMAACGRSCGMCGGK